MSGRFYGIFFVYILLHSSLLRAGVQPVVLSDTRTDYFVSKNRSEHFEDPSGRMDIAQVKSRSELFVENTSETLYNQPASSAHWLRFKVVNKTSHARNFKLELFDFDLEEVSFFLFQEQQQVEKQMAGFRYPFHTRSVPHKNLAFDLDIAPGDTVTVYMRFYSGKLNALEPVIRHHNRMLEYALAEYILLGVFYGLVLLMLVFNFIYFLILRNAYFLYYVFFIAGILLYLISRNGTGFQYLWPSLPQLNPYMETLSLFVGIVFMLLFSVHYLNLAQTHPNLKKALYGAAWMQVAIVGIHLYMPSEIFYKIAAVISIQLSFVAGLAQYFGGMQSVKWYVVAFVVLNISFVITLLEYLGHIPSSAGSVYALNGGVVGQFIFLSVGLAESVRASYKEKNTALSQLVEALNQAESMRIVELKRQMNPHFIFNALNSILHRIRSDKKDDAAQFLVQFSRLIRKTLDTSDKLFVTLEEELDTLRLYLDIEILRLGNAFEYTLSIAENIPISTTRIPAFVIQPFVENAIWHGLIPKEGLRKLTISISCTGTLLTIQIADNGIGRAKSMEYKPSSAHESKGIALVQERLKRLELAYHRRATVYYTDAYLPEKTSTGTTVTLEIEIQP